MFSSQKSQKGRACRQAGFVPIIFIIAVLVVSAGIAGGAFYYKNNFQKQVNLDKQAPTVESTPNPTQPPSFTDETQEGYKQVSVKELTGNMAKYDNQKVIVKGVFKNIVPSFALDCMPTGSDKNPKIMETYKLYRENWGIADGEDIIGLKLVNSTEGNKQYSSLEGEELEIKGVAKSTTVGDECKRDIRYRTIYIEVDSENIDVPIKVKKL